MDSIIVFRDWQNRANRER